LPLSPIYLASSASSQSQPDRSSRRPSQTDLHPSGSPSLFSPLRVSFSIYAPLHSSPVAPSSPFYSCSPPLPLVSRAPTTPDRRPSQLAIVPDLYYYDEELEDGLSPLPPDWAKLAPKRRCSQVSWKLADGGLTSGEREEEDQFVLSPETRLSPRDLLRSPIRSLHPSSCYADHGADRLKRKRRKTGDDDADDGQLTPTCSPRTTLSLHAVNCHNTPKPDYDDMSNFTLKARPTSIFSFMWMVVMKHLQTLLSSFGVRGGPRKWMVDKLTEIWEASHDPSKALPLGRDCNRSSPGSKITSMLCWSRRSDSIAGGETLCSRKRAGLVSDREESGDMGEYHLLGEEPQEHLPQDPSV